MLEYALFWSSVKLSVAEKEWDSRMPNSQSAMKRMRSDAKKHTKNLDVLSELHTRYKKLLVIAQKDGTQAQEQARILVSKLDKAIVQGVIPHRRADRKKARIARLISKK